MIFLSYTTEGHASPAILNPENRWTPINADTEGHALEKACAHYLTAKPQPLEFTVWITRPSWPWHDTGRPVVVKSFQCRTE